MNTIESAIQDLKDLGVISFEISENIGERPFVITYDCNEILHKAEELTVLASLQAIIFQIRGNNVVNK